MEISVSTLMTAREMVASGSTGRNVCAALKISKGTVHKYCKGVSRNHLISDFVEFEGKKYFKNEKGYWRCKNLKMGKTYLHRDVWEHFNGPIPMGYHIHHRDLDKSNNDLSNLELVFGPAHVAWHRSL